MSKCTESPEKTLELDEDVVGQDPTADDEENDQDADIEDEKVTFLIGQQTEDEDEIPKHRQNIYDNNVCTYEITFEFLCVNSRNFFQTN